MQRQGLVRLPVEFLQELEGLVVAAPGLALANDRACLHVERRKQGRAAVALIAVRHRPAFPRLHRQAGLAAAERLDLAFPVDGKHGGQLLRVQVRPTTSRSFSANSGSFETLEPFAWWGFSLCSRQMPCTAIREMPTCHDIVRQLHCVAATGLPVSVKAKTSWTFPVGRGGIRDGRALPFLSPSTPLSR
jgi:hypothetical protein